MPTATRMGQAGLQGWRTKVGASVAGPVSRRTRLSDDQVRAVVGAVFFVLALLYVAKALRAGTRAARE
jgi:hypothetical protein